MIKLLAPSCVLLAVTFLTPTHAAMKTAPAANQPPTAFQARAIAEQQLSEQAKGKLMQISSLNSPGTRPATWRFLFWDPYAAQNCRAITVSNGKVAEIKEGYVELDRMRLAAYKQEEIMDSKRLKLDSDAALARALKTTALKGIPLTTATFKLKKASGPVAPVWVIGLWVDRNGQQVDIGTVKVSSETGEIFEMALKLEKLNK